MKTGFAKRSALTAAVICLAGVGAAHAAAITTEGFEDFSNTSGTTVANYNGPIGKWTNSSGTSASGGTASAVVIKNDATAYAGSGFLRMNDTATDAVAAATLALTKPVAADGATVSFALRDDGSFNSDQVIIKAGTVILGQIGLQNNGATSGKVTYTSYTSATNGGAVTTQIGNTFGVNGTSGNSGWYLFNLKYTIANGTASYALTITDPKNAQFYSGTLNGNTGLTAGQAYNISAIIVQTNGGKTGSADVDAITVAAPEPAAMSLVGFAGAGVMLKRRRQKRA